MKTLASSLIAFAIMAGAPVLAQDAQKPGIKLTKKNCTCRFMGRKYELGVMLCLKTPKGPRMARCELNLNNTSWKPTSTPCHISGMIRQYASANICRTGAML